MREKLMSISNCSDEKTRKLLIITCSGGGGLIQAANAKEQEVRIRDPNVIIIRRDALKDWIWLRLGHLFVYLWNGAQTRGNVSFLSFCIWGQLFVDRFFWSNFFFSALFTLFREDIDEIIDTQNMGTSAIVTAVRIYNFRRKKQIRIQKVLVDLPTKKATHFFWPIKTLSKKNRKLIQLITIPPLLEAGETPQQFWKSNCRLSEEEISYEGLNVRQSFRKFQGKGRTGEHLKVKIHCKSSEELSLMRKSYKRGSIRGREEDEGVEFSISPDERLITILLGSQPGNEATFNYMKKFLQLAKEPSTLKIPTHLFIFCLAHKPKEDTLFRKVADFVGKIKEYPSHFSIIPFSFQTDDVIAPLFFRSDLTCTRSGGQTAMELMCVSSGEIWIHSEAKKNSDKELSMEDLLNGIFGWEGANALYLQKICGAKIVTPETFSPHARRILRSDGLRARPTSPPARQLESTA